jgi:hypothetical protein
MAHGGWQVRVPTRTSDDEKALAGCAGKPVQQFLVSGGRAVCPQNDRSRGGPGASHSRGEGARGYRCSQMDSRHSLLVQGGTQCFKRRV